MQKGRTKNAIVNDRGPSDTFDKATIEKLAYENWLCRGCPEGSAEIDWIEAERILQATRGAFADDSISGSGLLETDVRAAGEAAMAELERVMAGDDHLKIRAAVEALDIATKPFAQARMNRAVGAQLRGKTIEEIEEAGGR